MISRTAKILLLSFTMLAASMFVVELNITYADTITDKPTKEFIGTLKTETRQIGDFLYVKHTFFSDGLRHHNVDHIYLEEIAPIPKDIDEKTLQKYISEPVVTKNKKFELIHEDEYHKLQEFQNEKNSGTPISTYQQWNVVGENSSFVRNVLYDPTILFASHTENWASKKNSNVYSHYDPINLIWSDGIDDKNKLIKKVKERLASRGWNDSCGYATDLWINISGVWTKQTAHFFDNIGGGFCDQYHIRAWAVDDDLVIGSAHEEYLEYKWPWEQVDIQHISTTGPNFTEYDIGTVGGYYHLLKGFDSAEDEAAEEFSESCWNNSKDYHWMNNEYTRKTFKNNAVQGSAYNDGYATVINCT